MKAPHSFLRMPRTAVLAACLAAGSLAAQPADSGAAGRSAATVTPGTRTATSDADAPRTASPTAPGAATRAWLELQRSGTAAGSSHPMPGEIASHVWRRHADSFRQPIPESFSSTLPRRGTPP